MIELWSKEQIAATLPQEHIDIIKYEAARYPMPAGKKVIFPDGSEATILEATSVTPSAIRIVVNLARLTAAITYNKAGGTTVDQVRAVTTMVPVTTYENVRK